MSCCLAVISPWLQLVVCVFSPDTELVMLLSNRMSSSDFDFVMLEYEPQIPRWPGQRQKQVWLYGKTHPSQILKVPILALTALGRARIRDENHRVTRAGHVYHVLSLDTKFLARQQQLQQTLPLGRSWCAAQPPGASLQIKPRLRKAQHRFCNNISSLNWHKCTLVTWPVL